MARTCRNSRAHERRRGARRARPGVRRQLDLVQAYVARVACGVKLARPMKIAIDCGNGVAGAVAPQLFRALGCEVTELFCEVDGTFPNHHPDPAEPKNLRDLIDCVANTDCELGLAFDGDGDRLGVVTKSGQIIWPDRQLVLFARDVLDRNPGATIIYDVKCSRHVGLSVQVAGGQPMMWKTGHSLVKAKLAETGAPLAGEMSGHIFFKERWYGFDDGLYTGARLLEIVSRHADACAPLEALPQDVSTPELKLEMEEGQPFTLVRALQDHGQFLAQAGSSPSTACAPNTRMASGWRALEYHASGGAAFRGAERRGAGPHPPISDANWPNWRQKPSCHSRIKPHVTARQPRLEDLRRSAAAPRAAESDCESSMLPDCDWTSAPRPNLPSWNWRLPPAAAAGLRSGAHGCSTGQRQLDRATPAWHTALRAGVPRDGRARRAVRTRTRAPIRARRRRRRQLFQRAAPGHRRQRLGPRLITRALRQARGGSTLRLERFALRRRRDEPAGPARYAGDRRLQVLHHHRTAGQCRSRHELAAGRGRPIPSSRSAITANVEAALNLGISRSIFQIGTGGGRYSLWSAIGLPGAGAGQRYFDQLRPAPPPWTNISQRARRRERAAAAGARRRGEPQRAGL